MRGQRGASDHGITIVAITESGSWVETMAGFVPDSDAGFLLVGVYVAPDFRGSTSGLSPLCQPRVRQNRASRMLIDETTLPGRTSCCNRTAVGLLERVN